MSAGTGSGLWLNVGEQNVKKIVDRIRQLMEGRSNAVGTATLSSTGATSTSITAVNCGQNSHVHLTPLTPSAATMQWYILSTNVGTTSGGFIVNHTSSTSTSLNFSYGIQG